MHNYLYLFSSKGDTFIFYLIVHTFYYTDSSKKIFYSSEESVTLSEIMPRAPRHSSFFRFLQSTGQQSW